MPPSNAKLGPEDWVRLAGYLIGATWGVVFALWTPSSYAGVISQSLVHLWSALVAIGTVTAILGVLTRRDVKVELSGIYIIAVGGLLYLVAQVGFSGSDWLNRIPLFIFILWHLSLLLPRLVGLEVYRRRVHAAHEAATE